MTLLFGNLIQAYVNFGVALNNAKDGVPGAAEQVPAAAASVKHAANLNGTYFVYIGKPPASTAIAAYLISVRDRNFCLHPHLYVDMDLHGRSQCKTYQRKIFKGYSQARNCVLR